MRLAKTSILCALHVSFVFARSFFFWFFRKPISGHGARRFKITVNLFSVFTWNVRNGRFHYLFSKRNVVCRVKRLTTDRKSSKTRVPNWNKGCVKPTLYVNGKINENWELIAFLWATFFSKKKTIEKNTGRSVF
jgi:hypothetical protein